MAAIAALAIGQHLGYAMPSTATGARTATAA